MRLRHGGFGPVQDVRYELGAVRQRHLTAVDIPSVLLIDQEQVITARAAADVDVLPNLDETVRAEDGQAAVPPARQAFRGKPVDADVAGAATTSKHHVAKVFELWVLFVMDVAH